MNEIQFNNELHAMWTNKNLRYVVGDKSKRIQEIFFINKGVDIFLSDDQIVFNELTTKFTPVFVTTNKVRNLI